MTLPIGHFGIGFAITFGLSHSFLEKEYFRPLLSSFGGIFAMVPDLSKFGIFSDAIHDLFIMNVFLGHHFIDNTLEKTVGNYTAAALGLGLLILCLAYYTKGKQNAQSKPVR